MTFTPRTRKGAREPLDRLARTIRLLTGQPATAEVMRQFEQYLSLLILWNRSQRLTGVLTPASIVTDLFEDSLLFLTRLPPGPLKIADIGAGAGIPGVPLAIVRPEISMTLIEAKRKRVSFLLAVKRELGATTKTVVLEGRAEDLIEGDPRLRGTFDAVVSRAAGPIKALLPIAMPYLAVGWVFVGAGPPPSGEAQTALKELGVQAVVVDIQEIGCRRTLLVASRDR